MKFFNNEIIWGFLVCFVINELKRFLFVVYMIEKKKVCSNFDKKLFKF